MSRRGVYDFESIDESLPFVPLSARRALDVLGRHLSLEGWRSLSVDERGQLVRAGSGEAVDPAAHVVVDRATPPASPTQPSIDPDPAAPPAALIAALGAQRGIDSDQWRALGALDRYALVKCASKGDKLARAYDEIVGPRLTHVNAAGEARMVDVGGKAETVRRAVASARLRTTPAAVDAIGAGRVAKGDVIAAARIAGILAAKRTPELVPLCHPVRTTSAEVDFALDAVEGAVIVRAVVEAVDRTGVEMEAMMAASIAALTLYDMVKSMDRWASIETVRLEAKSGGKSGSVRRPPTREGSP